MEIWIGGVFCNWKYSKSQDLSKFQLGGYSVTSDLDLGKKVGNLDFWGGGYSVTSDLDLGKKLEIRIFGGVFCNFGFGLRKKSWKFGFGGVFCNFGFGLREKSWKFGFWGGYSVKVMEKDCNWKYSKSQDLSKFQLGGGIL